MSDAATPKRRRGRPRAAEGVDRRAAIVAAAADEFAERGYDGATMRAIAQRAGVDPALLHHYFGTKSDLFGETIGVPLRPDLALPAILAGPPEEVGEAIARYLLTSLEDPHVRKRVVMLVRTGIGTKAFTPLFAGFLRREVLAKVAASLETPDAELRTSLVASQIAGLLVARYILELPGLATAPVPDVVRWVGPTLQRYLTG
ncbi:MAG: TetR/AcrR family transcriptional regulator [Cellulomonadaceae bacterium]